jgi:phenylalanyl-tRNA synthetase beta chain
VSRGFRDLALYNIGQVAIADGQHPPVPEVGVDKRPSEAELAALYAALPRQPKHVGVVLAGNRQHAGWWGKAEQANWADAVQAARTVADVCGVELTVTAGNYAPWHPGRCAELRVAGQLVGHAGELHPKVIEALDLPKRTCAMEIDLDALPLPSPAPAPQISSYPPVLLDVALVAGSGVPSADLEQTLRQAAGPLLESIRLFDVYADEARLGAGRRSLAYALHFRAADRTLTLEEATAARDAAVAAAVERYGVHLRT